MASTNCFASKRVLHFVAFKRALARDRSRHEDGSNFSGRGKGIEAIEPAQSFRALGFCNSIQLEGAGDASCAPPSSVDRPNSLDHPFFRDRSTSTNRHASL